MRHNNAAHVALSRLLMTPHPEMDVPQHRLITIYTDGACSGNPGVGAWAYRIEWPDGQVEEKAEATRDTTNNREELKAIREALLKVRDTLSTATDWRAIVYTDSLGAINWLNHTWKRNKNLDLFPTIDPLLDSRISLTHVRGHSGVIGNERVDRLAVAAVEEWVRRNR